MLSNPGHLKSKVSTYTWHWQGQTINIVSETSGSGPSVLMLPAFSTVSTRAELAALAKQLTPHFQITTIDWPGFGESDRPRLAYHPDFYRQFLQAFVKETFPQDVAVIAAGHAAGYALAIKSWSRMVLVAPTWRGPLAAMGAPESIRSGVRELVRAPLIGQFLYGLNTRPGFLKWMYSRHANTKPVICAPRGPNTDFAAITPISNSPCMSAMG